MLRINEPAQADLKEIWLYLAEKDVNVANQIIEDFGSKFKLLEQNPKIGRERNDLLLNLRSFSFKNYLIFYIPLDNGVEIFRVLHGSRNIENVFENYFEGLSE